MGSSVPFYAAPEDDGQLVGYAESLGLVLVPPVLPDGELSASSCRDPNVHALCYLSVVGIRELHPYGSPPNRVSPATDALIEFHRSRLDSGTLTIGRIYWSDDVPELAKRTKPSFERLKKWMKATWQKRERVFVGPAAARFQDGGGRFVGLGIPVVRIDPNSPRQ
jgi:hypothetical protein